MSLPASRTVWEEGHESGREMAALGVALALTAAALDLVLGGQIGLLFDLAFVLLCLALALAVHPRDFFTVGVLPPILMLATFTLLAMTRSESIARAEDGLVQAIVSGLSHHSLALVIGYLLALAVLVVRVRVRVQRESLTRSGPGRRLRA
ncbi:DUF6542 domain-containing protein [Nocardioides sp.]|uniref:DUF6542 domain-containing protein n=1 Tax=Nocardioides sp. TaxID=35761 RepID=UPI0026208BAA|nr:DUF6542 domain-containing protein [Nocardioides sp.]